MKKNFLTMIGALLIVTSSAFANEPSQEATGAKNDPTEKSKGVCDCNTHQKPPRHDDNRDKYDYLLNNENPGKAAPEQNNGSDSAKGTN